MKTTVEIPDSLFRLAKSNASERGISLKEMFTEALREELRRRSRGVPAEKPWMRAFGQLKRLHRENMRVEKTIEDEFSRIDEEEWR